MDSRALLANGSRRKLRLLPLLATVYFMVSGGPYGLEEIIGDAGYGWAFVILFATPFFWSMPTVLMIGELAAAIPEEGGFYAWVRRALGPFWGFQEAWLSLAASIFDMAIYPTLFVTYLEHFSNWGPVLQSGCWELSIKLAVVVVATLWNLRGAVSVGNGSVVMWLLGLSPFIVLIAAALWQGAHTGAATLRPAEGHADLAAGVLVALWNYMGWDNASTIAGEVAEPQRTYPRVMIIAVLMTMATYLLPIAAVWFAGIAPDQFSTGAWVDAAQNLVGYPLALTLTLVASLDSLGNFNSLTLSYTRLPYAMACDGMLPKVLTRRLPNGVPWVSLLLCALGWSLALGLKFDKLITIDISLWGLSVLLEFVALVKLRFTEPNLPRPFRVPGPTWVAVSLGAGPAVLIVFTLWTARADHMGPVPAALFALVTAVLGVPLYALARWRVSQRSLAPESTSPV